MSIISTDTDSQCLLNSWYNSTDLHCGYTCNFFNIRNIWHTYLCMYTIFLRIRVGCKDRYKMLDAITKSNNSLKILMTMIIQQPAKTLRQKLTGYTTMQIIRWSSKWLNRSNVKHDTWMKASQLWIWSKCSKLTNVTAIPGLHITFISGHLQCAPIIATVFNTIRFLALF